MENEGISLMDAVVMRLEELLDENQMTPYRLSCLSGVPQATIRRQCKRQNDSVELRVLHEIVQGFSINLSDFFNSPLFKAGDITDWYFIVNLRQKK